MDIDGDTVTGFLFGSFDKSLFVVGERSIKISSRFGAVDDDGDENDARLRWRVPVLTLFEPSFCSLT